MSQTLTFAKVFTAEGEKNGKSWKRWDYKTADGQRFVSFKTGSIPLDVVVDVEISGDNKIESWKATGSHTPAGSTQTAPELQDARPSPQNGVQRVTEGKPDWDAIARGKVKSLLWAALLPAMFSSLSKAEQTVENAGHLVTHAMTEIFPDDGLPPF